MAGRPGPELSGELGEEAAARQFDRRPGQVS